MVNPVMVSPLEQTAERIGVIDYSYGTMAEEAHMLLETIDMPKIDLRRREQIPVALISESDYEGALQLAWDLLAHPDQKVWKVGDDLLHRLIDYDLARKEYLTKPGND
ncbi:MAG: hypothetical protein AABX32_01170 [Nanoarchaeota archaeon]